MKILIKNIKQLVQVEENPQLKIVGKEMKILPCINDAWLAIEDDKIAGFGKMDDWEGITDWTNLTVIDASDKIVMPSYCDSHTHIVYAGSREGEFVDRINGLTYEQIFERGGGILNSAKKLMEATEEDLIESALKRLNEIMLQGTGAVEIKSGYGLSIEAELKMLRVIKKLKTISPLTIKATFLGAHALPNEYKTRKSDYIKLLINEIMPVIAKEQLADYCDVFCEQNYFTKEETIEILTNAKKHGMTPKVHAEQLSNFGGVLAGVEVGAISVDHLEFISDKDIEALKNSKTMPTILPGAAFFLNLPLPPARKMIDAGLPVAIASDYNPGSCPSGNMNFMMSICCIQYKMTPEEAINAATINSAYAMDLSKTHGSIAIGKLANVFITKEIPGYGFIPYSFGSNLIETVIINGEVIETKKVK
ncbi:MAG: imidazolonepropionase [Bacteroidetes bacterium RIFCSPLOWO2_12_FULL_35_15]|nr:MAG: imidazolonepropionase [Bacteroidetes bacterium RIFCSPLOWO2_12_FULL_35_15]